MPRLALIAVVLCCSASLLSSCGNSRTPVPNLAQPAQPSAFRTLHYSGSSVQQGVRRTWSIQFGAPSNWLVVPRRPPVVTVVSSGNAVVALWRYGRSAPTPVGADAYGQARRELTRAARRRDPSIQLISAENVQVAGDQGIELDAIEAIGGQRRRVRSTHLWVDGAEVVLDEYAPPAAFHSVDHSVFSPLKQSLRLSVTSPTSG